MCSTLAMGGPFIISGCATVQSFDLEGELHKHIVEASGETSAWGKHIAGMTSLDFWNTTAK